LGLFVRKKGAGEFTLPGLFSMSAQKRFGKNPFLGQFHWFAAKPVSVKVKAA
jgi:hypothetical protein